MPVADPRIFLRRPPGNGALEWLFRHFPDGDVTGLMFCNAAGSLYEYPTIRPMLTIYG